MRINPVTPLPNYRIPKPLPKKTPAPVQSNLPSPMYYTPVNFRGVTSTSLELVKQIPLEDRIASIFQNFKLGDLLLVGKDMQECARKMYETAELGKNAIKRGFFIADEKLGGSLGFLLNSLGDKEVVNLNDFDIPLITNNKTYPLKPKESFYIVDDDVLSVQGNLLPIKNKPKADLSMFRRVFARAFNFEKEVEPKIESINKKTLSQLMINKHKGSSKVTFADVGGLDKLKEALKRDIIYPIRYPEAYQNIDVNHGSILYGPPGTGKTHIARALANEAGANFISLNGLDLESKWVGESEKNWRELFQQAKDNQPAIIFLDEFDAVARSRSSHDEYGNKVVNQILTLMTDIDNEGDNVFVMAATNNYEVLDKAITRAGRFGKHYKVEAPDLNGLRDIFKIHTKNKPVDENVDVETMLKKLESLKATGADIRLIVNEAHNHGYVRAGIFDKMDNKTYQTGDIKSFKIIQEDFNKAIEDFVKDKQSSTRRPIGYR